MSCINTAGLQRSNGNGVRRNAAKLPNVLTDFFSTVGQKLAVNVLDFCFDCYFFFPFFLQYKTVLTLVTFTYNYDTYTIYMTNT